METEAAATAAARFSRSAAEYAATMVPSLRPVAAEVVRRARLRPGERVLDVGTGTGIAAAASRGQGRSVTGLDAAPGMLSIARREVDGVEFVEADFTRLPFADAAFDVLISAHALLFADDRIATLREWQRVTVSGGRLSLSVPGPGDRVPLTLFGPIHDRYGLPFGTDYPSLADVRAWAEAAGWTRVQTAADPDMVIRLADDDAFVSWLRVGSRGGVIGTWDAARLAAFTRELLAVAPRDRDGSIVLPFGALYLTATNIEA